MGFKRSLYAIIVFMVVLVNMNSARVIVSDKSNILTEQLVQKTSKLGFKIDQSQIETVYSEAKGSNDVIVGVPLSKVVDTTSDQIEKGETYVGIQCIATKGLNGCFKVRLASVDDNGPTFELVNDDGKVVASKTVPSPNQLVKRAANAARHLWCLWINGDFYGCYDVIIIIFTDLILVAYK